jgi:hypothetical protein
MVASSWVKGGERGQPERLGPGLVLSHKLDPAVYHQALGAGALEVLATNMGIGEFIDAVRRSAATE